MTDDPSRSLVGLRAVVGDENWRDHDPIEIDDRRFESSLRPEDPEALSLCVRGLVDQRRRALIHGSGSRIAHGNLALGADVLLSTRGLSGVRRFEPDDGVIEVWGGTRIEALRDVVGEAGWELPLDAPGIESTVGGTIATAACGPRSLMAGPVRRAVLGLEVVLGSGELTRCGGRVVKNVTGYDLAKIYTGSFGTLGVIASAWLRLSPKPRHVEVRVVEFSETESALACGIAASRRSSSRACALVSPEVARDLGLEHTLAASWLLMVEFAGEEVECVEDVRWLEEAARMPTFVPPAGPGAGNAIDRLRDLLARPLAADDVRARVAALPSALAQCCAPLLRAGARLAVMPGMGLVHAEVRAPDVDAADARVQTGEPTLDFAMPTAARADARPRVLAAIDAVTFAARESNGTWALESIPAWAKRDRDVFDDCSATAHLMRRLKDEFDPHGVLNAGRFAGGI